MRVWEIMSEQVARVGPDDTVQQARTLMRTHGIHHLVVFGDHAVLGLLTSEHLSSTRADAAATVADLMSRNVPAAARETTVRQAANLMRGTSVGALPVIDKGELVGIITVSDLLELVGRGLEQPVRKSTRWVLKNRGVRPNRTRAGQHR